MIDRFEQYPAQIFALQWSRENDCGVAGTCNTFWLVWVSASLGNISYLDMASCPAPSDGRRRPIRGIRIKPISLAGSLRAVSDVHDSARRCSQNVV